MNTPSLDRIDRDLLAHLQRNNRSRLRDLASRVGISAPTCLRRIRRLESLGVIRAHTALLDSARAGFAVRAYVEVSLHRPSGAEMTAFERRMRRCPDVLQCSELAGEVDYLLVVVARDMAAFAEFSRRHLADDPAVRAYRSLMVLKETKNEHVLPV